MATERDQHPRTPWGIAAVAVAAWLTGVGMGWTAARAYVADQLQQLEDSKEWKLPENLKALGELSGEVALHIRERKELLGLRRDLPLVQAELTKLREQKISADTQLRDLGRKVADYESETIDVPLGEARFVIPKLLAIGVSGTNKYSNEAQVRFDDKEQTIKPGASLSKTVNGKTVTLTLLKVREGSCTFSVTR